PREQSTADLNYIRNLISYLENRLAIDPARVYATGISNGAQMTHHLGCELAGRIAAIAPVSGGYPTVEQCQPDRPVPVVAFHGTADNILPYAGQGRLLQPVRQWAAGWAARNGCAPSPKVTMEQGQVVGETWSHCRQQAEVTLYTIKEGGHGWPGSNISPDLGITTHDINATEVIWDFFASHPKP
ncbi:MAG: hypothetical protein AB1801_25445, partial [Chloroflexota bacterium]